MIEITFLGECMLEHHAGGEFRYGGDTLNTALYLARLTERANVKVYYATSVGTDSDSQILLSQWQSEGIDTTMVTQSSDRTLGRYRIATNTAGERKFEYQRDESAARFYLQSNPVAFWQYLSGAANRFLYLSGISLAIISQQDRSALFERIAEFKANDGRVIFDNNYRPVLWLTCDAETIYQHMMSLADIVFLTDEDEYALYPDCHNVDDILKRTEGLGIDEIVIKQGSSPCIIKSGHDKVEVAATIVPANKIVDTSAAGDSFAAGYLSKRFCQHDVAQAARFGHAVAAQVIQHAGAIVPRTAMESLLS